MKFYFLFVLFSFPLFLAAQEYERVLTLNPMLNQESLELGKKVYVDALQDSIKIETLKFYMGHVTFYQEDTKVAELPQPYYLIDAENPSTLRLPLPTNTEQISKITFNLGVDSLTSVSGVFGGDLDPTNGMYWTWQSGYINVKLEGKADKCPARNRVFQYHIGGYQAPFNTLQNAEFSFSKGGDIHLNIALDSFLSQVNLLEKHRIMSPNEEAVKAAKLLLSTFSISE